jgi:glutamate:GABA antiporter
MFNKSKGARLGVFVLAMMNVAIVCTLRGLPIMAEEGFSLIFYYFVAGLFFLIPVSLVSAELATGWPPNGPGGVYIWVHEAFGKKFAFLAMWLQWIQNVVWFPTILSFIAATVAYVYDPALAENKIYAITVILITYWGGTLINFRGMKASGMVSLVGVLLGTILPGIFIIMMGVWWVKSGQPLQIDMSLGSLVPDFSNINNIVFLAGALLIFSGMEVSAVHAQDVRDPKREYPRAIFLAAGISLVLLTLGSLAIAVIVPQQDLSLVAGIMEAFTTILRVFHLEWLIPVFAVFITIGLMAELSAWIIGPSKGLLVTAMHGSLPPFLQKTNDKGVPTNILILQGVITTLMTLVFLFMPTVSSSYWMLSAFCILIYLIMYLLMFAAAIYLRYKRPDVPRNYRVPGGNLGMWVVAGAGFIASLFTIVVSFFPPSQIRVGSESFYEEFLIIGTLIVCAVPFIVLYFKHPGWMPKKDD